MWLTLMDCETAAKYKSSKRRASMLESFGDAVVRIGRSIASVLRE
jgi:hypothetical protein